MLWVPSEVETLRSKAHQQAQANQIRKDGDAASSSLGLEVTLGSELLKSDGKIGRSQNFTLQPICGGVDEILQACIRPGVVSLAAEGGSDRSTVSSVAGS